VKNVHRLRGREISANQFDLAWQRGAMWISGQGADVRAAVKKLRDEDSLHDPKVSVASSVRNLHALDKAMWQCQMTTSAR